MPASVDVVHTRVFAAVPNGGNPCPVVLNADSLSEPEMLQLARHFGLDTAFILRPKSAEADVAIRYFVPAREMGISGHATIAALTVVQRHETVPQLSVKVETISGIFRATLEPKDGGRISVVLEQRAPIFGAIYGVSAVALVLGLPRGEFDVSLPIQSVSVSRAKLIVPIRSCMALNAIHPNLDALSKLCERWDVTGFYPFTLRTDKVQADIEARQFPYRAGFPEDAATGVAAGALAAYLTFHSAACRSGFQYFRIAQGYAMGAPSIIDAGTLLENQRIIKTFIRGTAVIINEQRIDL